MDQKQARARLKDLEVEIRTVETILHDLRNEQKFCLNAAADYPPGTLCVIMDGWRGAGQVVRVEGVGRLGFGYTVRRRRKGGGWYVTTQWVNADKLRLKGSE